MDTAAWLSLLNMPGEDARRRILLLGVNDDADRTQLLHLGFGEVLGDRLTLAELDARALRVARQADMLPRNRDLGGLRLDLIARDGFANGRPLGLHPREFGLVWRLADTPGVPASKAALLTDVWRLGHIPETNSLAVHVFRLRAKLALAGFDGLVQTTPSGGYLLVPAANSIGPAIPLLTSDSPLDSHTRVHEDTRADAREQRHEA